MPSEDTFVESLEARVTPAVYFSDVPNGDPTIVDPSTVTYRDADGDMVTVKFSKGIIDSQETLDAIFDFESMDIEGNLKGYDLKGISLENFAGNAKLLRNLDISVSAETSTLNGVRTNLIDIGMDGPAGVQTNDITQEFGDGHVNVGSINAAGVDLGDVSIDGNLGRITVGDNKLASAGLSSLTVESLGRLPGEPAVEGQFTSVITGPLKNLDIAHDLDGATLRIEGGKKGMLKSAHIGGDVVGDEFASGGSIHAEGAMSKLRIDGRLLGGEGESSGSIYAGRTGQLDITGGIFGGAGMYSGHVEISGNAGSVDSASVQGGSGVRSGTISILGNAQHVSLADVKAGSVSYTGFLSIDGNVKTLTVGTLLGNNNNSAGVVYVSENIGKASLGDLKGGSDNSGVLLVGGGISSLKIDGDLRGGGDNSGEVVCQKSIGQIKHTGEHSGTGNITRYDTGRDPYGREPGLREYYYHFAPVGTTYEVFMPGGFFGI